MHLPLTQARRYSFALNHHDPWQRTAGGLRSLIGIEDGGIDEKSAEWVVPAVCSILRADESDEVTELAAELVSKNPEVYTGSESSSEALLRLQQHASRGFWREMLLLTNQLAVPFIGRCRRSAALPAAVHVQILLQLIPPLFCWTCFHPPWDRKR